MEDSASYALKGKIMLCSVIILFLVVLIMACLHGARVRYRSHHRGNSRRRRLFHHHDTPNTIKSSQGLDSSVLKALSTFTYPSKTHDLPPECAVCLCNFVDDERGRVLPQCGHAFHVECIDTWFHAHSNCPVCRAPVQPDISDRAENEPAGSRTELDQREAAEMGSLGFSQPEGLGPQDGHRKPLDLVGIVVEMPRLRALDELGSGSPGGHGFKNPGDHNRVLSL